MLGKEAEALDMVRRCLDAGQADDAFCLLRRLKEGASEELQEKDMWQLHELFGACFHDLGDAEGAAQAYFQAAQCDRFLRSQRQHFSSYLFALHYLSHISDEEMAQQNLAYGSLYRDVEPLPPRGRRREGGKIRVGYLSPSFSEQAAARFYEVMLTEYDRERFDVFCYGMEPSSDDFACRMKSQADGWCELSGMGVEEAARRIRRDDLDILFDLGGHSEGGMSLMVMAYRPAPVQLSGIGWIDTTACPAMDYFLTDGILVPKGYHEEYFSEKLLRLSYAFCWRPTKEMQKVMRRPRKKGAPVRFGCFNNFMKITEEMLHAWQGILGQLPGAVLVLQDTSQHPARQREMRRKLSEAGLGGQVEVRPASPEYPEQLAGMDLLLDTYPYTGGGMTAAALYLGTPVLTMAGTRHGSRIGASLLRSVGLPGFVARDEAEYIAKAVAVARDEDGLAGLQMGLREQMEDSPLMDGKGYMRELERAYQGILESSGCFLAHLQAGKS